MAGSRIAGPTCQHRLPVNVNDGTSCKIQSPNPGSVGPRKDPVSSWSSQQKLLAAAQRATPKLPPGMRDQFAALFSKQNLAITGGVLTVWAASQFVGVGEIVDVILAVVGVIMAGWQAVEALWEIERFLVLAISAKSTDELEGAADHLARAVIMIGVTAFVILIMKQGSKFGISKPGSALAGFSAAENAVIAEAREVLSSPQMVQIRQAQAAGKEITLKFGGRVIQYEPNWPWSGLTDFEKNGFTLGRQAFTSEAELTKTVLHELYRLSTSVARGTGGGGKNNMETQAAFEFAERAFNEAFPSK